MNEGTTILCEAVERGNREKIESYFGNLDLTDNWSLVSAIDELLPISLMETNLRYANFHRVKMALFIRQLSLQSAFSEPTKKLLGRMIALDLINRKFIPVSAGNIAYEDECIEDALPQMIVELEKGNIHNAYYYMLNCLKQDDRLLFQTLLKLGAASISGTLGHSLSCFWPVIEGLASNYHKSTFSALFSYMMYLGRFSVGKEVLDDSFGIPESEIDNDAFLMRCASGSGIVDLHHMITFYVLFAWENSSLRPGNGVPLGIMENWIEDKTVDRNARNKVEGLQRPDSLPESFESFSGAFNSGETTTFAANVCFLLDDDPRNATDWILRLIASRYRDNWDPHYITGICCALQLYKLEKTLSHTARKMAVFQAVEYFAAGIL